MHIENIRHEFKYVLSPIQAREAEGFVRKIGLQKDSSQGGEYYVTSVYFDTPGLDDYYDKLAGLKYRRKLRARTYNYDFNSADGMKWLEIKEKHDMNILKKRREAGKDFKEFAYLQKLKNYKPRVVVRYKRKAYVANFLSPIRLTFDSRIETCKWRGGEYNDSMMLPVGNGAVVMEVKFRGAMPWWFREMTRRLGLSRGAFSKYTASVDAINRFNPMPR